MNFVGRPTNENKSPIFGWYHKACKVVEFVILFCELEAIDGSHQIVCLFRIINQHLFLQKKKQISHRFVKHLSGKTEFRLLIFWRLHTDVYDANDLIQRKSTNRWILSIHFCLACKMNVFQVKCFFHNKIIYPPPHLIHHLK